MDEKKTDSFEGMVTIRVQEFYDLVNDRASYKKDADHYQTKLYSEQSKVRNLEGQLEGQKEALEKLNAELATAANDLAVYRDFIRSSDAIAEAFNLFLFEKGGA